MYVCFCVFVLPILNLPETSWEAAWHSLGSFCYYTSGGNDILRLQLSIDFVNQRRGNACPYKLWRLLIKKIPCAAFILTVVFFSVVIPLYFPLPLFEIKPSKWPYQSMEETSFIGDSHRPTSYISVNFLVKTLFLYFSHIVCVLFVYEFGAVCFVVHV